MTLKQFVKKYRKEIDKVIGNPLYQNDEEREAFVLNDEGLYVWAKSEGIKI